MLLVVPPSDQLYAVSPAGTERSMFVVEQFSTVVFGVLEMEAEGAATSWVMITEPEAVQPLAAVTVTLYVEGAVTVVLLVILPFDQLYDASPDGTDNSIPVVEQLSTVVFGFSVIEAEGAVTSWVMNTELEAVQPLEPVTVTVYVSAKETGMLLVVPPVDQLYVSATGTESVILVVEQFRTVVFGVLVIKAEGAVISWVMITEPEAVHPLAAVTVTL
jgi:hypothetical protein